MWVPPRSERQGRHNGHGRRLRRQSDNAGPVTRRRRPPPRFARRPERRALSDRRLRDQRDCGPTRHGKDPAVARYGGLTGSPDRSGATSRERGMARSGNARVRRGMIQLAWRFLLFQKDSALAQWYRRRTEHAPKARKTMIVALARKLLIALWGWCTRAWCRRVSPCARRNDHERLVAANPDGFRLDLLPVSESPMTVRGGGVPGKPWLSCRCAEWARRLGASPPMRKTASWFGSSRPTEYKVAARNNRA
jgi:hypothetical protein